MAIKLSAARFDLGGARVDNAVLKVKYATVNARGSVSGSQAMDFSLGNVVSITASGNLTLSITNPPVSGKTGTLTLLLTNGGAVSVAWPSGTTWLTGSAPSLTSSGLDVLSFTTTDGGTTWRAHLLMLNSS
ncbi:hypothetical protein K8Q93_00710 [Candidatus Parcubacteria bacterium]|nr:hypothetical protein [Candidatus Parcubacteria bacterium]